MNCKYIYKGVIYNSYQDLVKVIIEESKTDTSLLNSDLLFSAQDDTLNKLKEVKSDYFEILEKTKDGPELVGKEGSGTIDLQHFIDSELYESSLYTKLKPEEHQRTIIEDIVKTGISEDDARQQVAELYKHFDTIGLDSYVLHKLINNNDFRGNLDNVQRDFIHYINYKFIPDNKAKINDPNTSQSEREVLEAQNLSARKLVNNPQKSRDLCSGIQQAIASSFRGNKISQETSTMLKNVGLKNEIESLGLSLSGHIDFVIIDPEGNLSLYNYKVTSESIDSWEKSKLEKYKQEMVFLKYMLSSKGFNFKNIYLNLIPIRLKYNEDFSDVDSIVVKPFPINLDVKYGKDALKNIDAEVSKIIPPKSAIEVPLDFGIQRAISINEAIFPQLDMKQNRIAKTVNYWITNHFNKNNSKAGSIIELDADPKYAYKVITDDGEVHMVEERTPPKNNKEINTIVSNYFKSLDESIDKVMNTLQREIMVAYNTVGKNQGSPIFQDSFGPKAAGYLHNILSYYYSYKDSTNGTRVFDWQLVQNKQLADQHILLFQNKRTKQLDVITLSMCNLFEKNKGKGNNTNILNSYLFDTQAGTLFNCKNYFGNIETVRTLSILNEVLPNIDIDFKLGSIKVISPVNNGNGFNNSISDFTKDVLPSIYKVVNQNNSGLNIVNNFSKFKYIDTFESITDQVYNLLNNPINQIDNNDKDLFIDYTTFDVKKISTEDGKIKVLTEMAKRMQEKYQDQIDNYSTYSDTKTKSIVNLYYTITQALSKYHGYNLITKNEPLSKLNTEYIKFSNMGDENVRIFNDELSKTIVKVNEQMFKEYSTIKPICDRFLKSKGYTPLQNSTVGNEASQFNNLFERDNSTNTIQMVFKNPFTDTSLNSEEILFLKRAIFEFAKIRHDINYKKSFKSIEDPEFRKSLEEDNKRLLWVPLMRASKATSRQNITFNDTMEKFKNIILHPMQNLKGFVDNIENSNDYETGRMSDFSLRNYFIGTENSYSERMAKINSNESGYYETNVKNILIKFAFENIKTRELNTMLILDKTLMFNIKMLGINSNNTKYTKQITELIEKFMKVNIYDESLLEPTTQKIFKYIDPLKKAVRTAYLAGNIIGSFRDLTEGLQQNLMRTLNKYQTDISKESLAKAYGVVVKDSFTNINSINKVNMLCLRYGLSNIDYSDVTQGLRTDRGGIYNADSYMYATMKRPDFVNRMTLFVSRCIEDGCWDAFKINENGQLEYDWKKDNRFKIFASGDTNNPNYNKQQSLYFSKVREYNQEHPQNPISFKDDLPMAYSNSEIESIKDVANSIYGAYEKNEKALYEHQAVGLAFGMFSTWMNGAVANYFKKPGLYNNGQKGLVQETDDAGNNLFFDKDGNITVEDTGVPVMKSVPILVQGVWYTLMNIKDILLGDDKVDNWKKIIWEDPMQRQNFWKFISDLLMSLLSTFLLKEVMTPAYNDYVKNADKADAFSNVAVNVMYKGVSNSWDGFKGPISIFTYIGNGMTPPYQAFTMQAAKQAVDLVTGKQTAAHVLSKDFSPFRAAQIQMKLLQAEN